MYHFLGDALSRSRRSGPAALVDGLRGLRRYLEGADSAALQEAYETLRGAAAKNGPARLEARLFEGVALELLEHHDDAEERFDAVLGDPEVGDLAVHANYHRAVSRLRRYEPSSLDEALTALGELLDGSPDDHAELENVGKLLASPIKAFALAASANAIAHQPIFWERQALEEEPAEDVDSRLDQKKRARPQIEAWIERIGRFTRAIEVVVACAANTKIAVWDELAVKQLACLGHNARGNMYLNSANYYYRAPELPGAGWTELRASYLESAKDRFGACNRLLTPGVEIHTNLATLYLALDDPKAARDEARAAIEVNDRYEYAYYRKAQAVERIGDLDEVERVLETLPMSPSIPSFKQMFDRYGVAARQQG